MNRCGSTRIIEIDYLSGNTFQGLSESKREAGDFLFHRAGGGFNIIDRKNLAGTGIKSEYPDLLSVTRTVFQVFCDFQQMLTISRKSVGGCRLDEKHPFFGVWFVYRFLSRKMGLNTGTDIPVQRNPQRYLLTFFSESRHLIPDH